MSGLCLSKHPITGSPCEKRYGHEGYHTSSTEWGGDCLREAEKALIAAADKWGNEEAKRPLTPAEKELAHAVINWRAAKESA